MIASRYSSASGHHSPLCAVDDVGQRGKARITLSFVTKLAQVRSAACSDVCRSAFSPPGILGRFSVVSAAASSPPICVTMTAGSMRFSAVRRRDSDHVLGVAAGRAHDMRGVIMHIIEIHLGAELLIGRPGKEIQAPIAAEDRAGQFDH